MYAYILYFTTKTINKQSGKWSSWYPRSYFTAFITGHFLSTSENRILKHDFYMTIDICSFTTIVVGHWKLFSLLRNKREHIASSPRKHIHIMARRRSGVLFWNKIVGNFMLKGKWNYLPMSNENKYHWKFFYFFKILFVLIMPCDRINLLEWQKIFFSFFFFFDNCIRFGK